MGSFVETVNTALSQLRSGRRGTQPLSGGERLAPGIWFDMDTEETDQTALCSTPPQGLLNVKLEARKPGRWFTLNIDLGKDDLSPHRLLGFALRSRAPRTLLARVCLRSFHDSGFEDVFFPLHVASFAEESSHADVLWLAEQPELRRPADWRTMIVFLDPGGVELVLTDMRLFVA